MNPRWHVARNESGEVLLAFPETILILSPEEALTLKEQLEHHARQPVKPNARMVVTGVLT